MGAMIQPEADTSREAEAALALSTSKIARALCSVASTFVVISLLMVKYMPRRFQIHPLPYLSDAGIRDPERILLSFGLALSGALFIPLGMSYYLYTHAIGSVSPLSLKNRMFKMSLRVTTERLRKNVFYATYSTAFFLALFSAVPGLMLFHHLFALFFAVSAAVWLISITMFEHARFNMASHENCDSQPWDAIRRKYVLAGVFSGCWVSFGITWILLKLGIPKPYIPNKDWRFVLLALLEYVSTSALLVFVYVVGKDLEPHRIRLCMSSSAVNHLCNAEKGM